MFRVSVTPRNGGRFDSLPIQRSPGGTSANRRQFASDAPQPARLVDRVLFLAYVLVSVYSENSADESGADPSGGGIIWALPYLVALVAVLVERKTAIRLARSMLPLVLVLLIALLSAFWSEAPAIAAQRSFGLLGYSMIAFALMCRLGLKGFLETVALLIMIEAAASIVLIVFFPGLGRMDEGEWRGVFVNKNELAQSMVLGMVTIACLGNDSPGIRRFQIPTLIFLFLLVAGSRSVSSLVIVLILALIFPLGLWSRAHYRKPVVLGGALLLMVPIIAAIMSAIGTDQLFGLLGKDATLTGRTSLWDAIIAAIGDRPILGYGYGVFWSNDGPAVNFMMQHEVLWDPGMAHDGFLEVALNVGLLGEAFLILLLVVGVVRATAAFWRRRNRLSAWPILAILYVILSNFSEANLERAHNVLWIVFVAAFLFATEACLPSPAINGRAT